MGQGDEASLNEARDSYVTLRVRLRRSAPASYRPLVGSGMDAQRLGGGKIAFALLGNTSQPTRSLGSMSGAHFDPGVRTPRSP